MLVLVLCAAAFNDFFYQEKEEQEQELREREFVAKREAERLEELEGGSIADGPIEQGTENDVHPSEQRILLDDKL